MLPPPLQRYVLGVNWKKAAILSSCSMSSVHGLLSALGALRPPCLLFAHRLVGGSCAIVFVVWRCLHQLAEDRGSTQLCWLRDKTSSSLTPCLQAATSSFWRGAASSLMHPTRILRCAVWVAVEVQTIAHAQSAGGSPVLLSNSDCCDCATGLRCAESALLHDTATPHSLATRRSCSMSFHWRT